MTTLDLTPAALAVLGAAAAGLHLVRTRGRDPWRSAGVGALVLCALAAVDAVLLPMPLDGQALDWRLRTNLLPGRGIGEVLGLPPRLAAYNLLGNLLVLAPLGFLAPWLWPRLRRAGLLAALGLVAGLVFETVQWFSGRNVDVDDALLNAAGAPLGLAVLRLMEVLGARRGAGSAPRVAPPSGGAARLPAAGRVAGRGEGRRR